MREIGIPVFDEGSGPGILIVHPGFDDGTAWEKVAAHLSRRFRVLRPVRRQYRAEAKIGASVSIGDEVRDILRVAEAAGQKLVIVGHSSGGIVALEALLAAPPGLFVGGAVYEPPLITGPPLGGAVLRKARTALDAGKPGKAMQIFVREIAHMPPAVAWVTRLIVALVPKFRRRVGHQLDDVQAIDELGRRLDAYRAIDLPVLVITGDQTVSNITDRSDALRGVLPQARHAVLRRQAHAAHLRDPQQLARVLAAFAGTVLAEGHRRS